MMDLLISLLNGVGGWSQIKACVRGLTCVLETRPHALVQLASPLPGPQLLVLVARLQREAVPLCLGCQLPRPPLRLRHQRAEVGLATLHAHDCNQHGHFNHDESADKQTGFFPRFYS